MLWRRLSPQNGEEAGGVFNVFQVPQARYRFLYVVGRKNVTGTVEELGIHLFGCKRQVGQPPGKFGTVA